MASIKNLLVPSKEVVVEYPGMPGFMITIAFLSRETLQKIRKKATSSHMKRGQLVENLDDELFLKLYVEATIKNWTGLTLAYLEQLAPVDIGSANKEDLVEYSQEDALALMKSSSGFDNFISDKVSDLGNFSSNS